MRRDIIWFSENWSHKLGRFDPKTEQFVHVQLPHFRRPLNAPAAGNLALAPDHLIWEARDGAVHMIDPNTGEVAKRTQARRKRAAPMATSCQPTGAISPAAAGRRIGSFSPTPRPAKCSSEETRTPRAGPEARRFRSGRQCVVRRHRRRTHQVRRQDASAFGIPSADAERDVLRMPPRQERRDLGRRALCRPLRAIQSQDRPLDRICAAVAGLARPAHLDRQFHRSGLGLVRRSRQHHGAHPAAGVMRRLSRREPCSLRLSMSLACGLSRAADPCCPGCWTLDWEDATPGSPVCSAHWRKLCQNLISLVYFPAPIYQVRHPGEKGGTASHLSPHSAQTSVGLIGAGYAARTFSTTNWTAHSIQPGGDKR